MKIPTKKAQTDPLGRIYEYDRVRLRDVTRSPWIFKEPRQDLVDALKVDLKHQWVLEAITCYREDGVLYLANGKHRLEAASQHDSIPVDQRDAEDKEDWLDRYVDAKVYLNLESEQIPDLVMSLDDVRKKAAAGERQVGLANTFRAARESATRKSKGTPDEIAVFAGMGYIKRHSRYTRGGNLKVQKAASRAVIIANHIQKLTEESPILKSMITQRQVPKSKLESLAAEGKYELITRENLAFALRHLVRAEPISKAEFKNGKSPRDVEFENLRQALEYLASDIVLPLAKTDFDQAVAMCRRYPLEAIGRVIRAILMKPGAEDAPLIRRVSDWSDFRRRLKRLKSVNWADPIYDQVRSSDQIYGGVPGEKKLKALRQVVFPHAP